MKIIKQLQFHIKTDTKIDEYSSLKETVDAISKIGDNQYRITITVEKNKKEEGMKKTIEQMIEELNRECNESLCFTYVMNWEIYSYNSEKLWDKYYGDRIRANNFRELIEKAMKKLGLNLEISQEEEDKIINAKKKTLEKLIKIAESRRKNDGK